MPHSEVLLQNTKHKQLAWYNTLQAHSDRKVGSKNSLGQFAEYKIGEPVFPYQPTKTTIINFDNKDCI